MWTYVFFKHIFMIYFLDYLRLSLRTSFPGISWPAWFPGGKNYTDKYYLVEGKIPKPLFKWVYKAGDKKKSFQEFFLIL